MTGFVKVNRFATNPDRVKNDLEVLCAFTTEGSHRFAFGMVGLKPIRIAISYQKTIWKLLMEFVVNDTQLKGRRITNRLI